MSPARERGTKMLKTGKVLKVYIPSAERMIRLSGHMLKQSTFTERNLMRRIH